MSENGWAIALHGGAGVMKRTVVGEEQERAAKEGLAKALEAGSEILRAGGAAEDAVTATVKVLEDNPLFNAGHGAVLTSEGTFELDAAVMRGRDLAAGAVMSLRHTANPVLVARHILEHSKHVIFTADGAQQYAEAAGFGRVEADYFETPLRRAQLEALQGTDTVKLDHDGEKYGTVGCVARDASGSLAAATSTGGLTNKEPGRVGDSPVFGAGTFADDASCAISATGQGEAFIRMTAGSRIAALVQHVGLSLEEATRRVIMEDLPTIGGDGGIIAMGREGDPVLLFNTRGMFRAWAREDGPTRVGMFAEDEEL